MKAALPHNNAPAGAPSPLEMEKHTESTADVNSAGGTPRAHRGIEQACSIEMHGNATLMGHTG